MTVISIINQKGGVGKSTLALHLGISLTKFKQKVLMIDMDPQGHLSLGLGIDKDNLHKTIFNVLDVRSDQHTDLREVAIDINNQLTLVPSNLELTTLDLILANRPGRENRLNEALHANLTNNYDYVIIDCPPNLGLLTINALVASDNIIVPFDTSAFSVDGINYLNNTLEMLNNKINHYLHVRYILNNFDNRLQKNRSFRTHMQKRLQEKLFKTVIRQSAFFEEAIRNKTTVYKIKQAANAQQDISKFTKEVMEWSSRPIRLMQKANLKDTTKQGKAKKTTFKIKNPYAREIKLAGSFNNWDTRTCSLKKISEDGTWEVTIPLTKGKHCYKFIVDGQWQEDTVNPQKEEVLHGVYNSVIEI